METEWWKRAVFSKVSCMATALETSQEITSIKDIILILTLTLTLALNLALNLAINLIGGRFEAGTRKGVGTCVWFDGMRYEGDWFSDRMTGNGILTTVEGDQV